MSGNNINDTLFMLDDIRVGLQSLDDEEENLIILKSHLAKIKKIREDQIRKDELVTTLKDRISVLENELTVSNRQSFELQEILSERIMTLENSLKDRNELEFNCYELTERVETLIVQKELTDADLEHERNKTHEHRISHTAKDEEIASLKAALQSDQQVIVQMQAYFESLKIELSNKEQIITVRSKKHKDDVNMLRNELAISKQTVDNMASQLLKSDEARLKLDEETLATRREIEQLRAEGTARHVELEQWKTMYQELEAVVLAVKTQLSATQDGLGQELQSLREELTASRQDTKDSRVELRSVHHTLVSITHDMDIISSFEKQHGGQNGHTRSTTQRAEIIALALSMQRSTASLDLTGDDNQNAPSNTLSCINHDIQRVVAFVGDLVHRLVAQQEEGAVLDHQLHQRSEAVTTASTLVSRFEEKYSASKQELINVDSALKDAVSTLQQCFLLETRDSGLVTRSNQSFLHQKTTNRGSPNKRSDTERRSDFKSESRSTLFDQLTQLVASAKKTATETVPTLRNELVALRAQSTDDLRQLSERHEAVMRGLEDEARDEQQRLINEIEALRRENEDAVVAVETTNYEAKSEVRRVKEQCRARLSENQLSLETENSDLHSSLRTCNERYQLVALSLEHVLNHTWPLLEKYLTLQSAYGLLYRHWFRRSDLLIQGVQALSECCDTIDESFLTGDRREQQQEEFVIHGKTSTTRPSASSRDQRIKHLREQQQPHGEMREYSASKPNYHRRKLVSLRVVGLLVLAANRFLRYRHSRHAALDDQTNLLAVSTAREAGLEGCGEASFQSHFLVCYPAFELPGLETLLSEPSRVITEQLLHAAAVYCSNGFAAFSSHGDRSLLDVVKASPHKRNRSTPLSDGVLCRRDIEHVQSTLLETCSQAKHWREAEMHSESLIHTLRSQLADLEDSLRNALATEQSQQARIDVLEKERRFGSLTILRDIHNELKEYDADVQLYKKSNRPATAPPTAAARVVVKRSTHFPSTELHSSGSRGHKTASHDDFHSDGEKGRHGSDDHDQERKMSDDEERQYNQDYSRDLREAMGGGVEESQSSSASLHFHARPLSEDSVRPRQTAASNSRYSNQSHSSSGEVYRAVRSARSSRFSNFSEYEADRNAAKSVQQGDGRSRTAMRDDRFDKCAAQVRDMINDSMVSRSLSETEGAPDRSFDAMNTTVNTLDSTDCTRTRLDDSGYSSTSRSHSRSESPSSWTRRGAVVSSAERRAARATANQSRDDDILEIYSDIGRLTGRLESRLRASSNASPEQSTHR